MGSRRAKRRAVAVALAAGWLAGWLPAAVAQPVAAASGSASALVFTARAIGRTEFQLQRVATVDLVHSRPRDVVAVDAVGRLLVFHGKRAGGFSVPTVVGGLSNPGGGGSPTMTVADVNGDGRPDVVLGGSALDNRPELAIVFDGPHGLGQETAMTLSPTEGTVSSIVALTPTAGASRRLLVGLTFYGSNPPGGDGLVLLTVTGHRIQLTRVRSQATSATDMQLVAGGRTPTVLAYTPGPHLVSVSARGTVRVRALRGPDDPAGTVAIPGTGGGEERLVTVTALGKLFVLSPRRGARTPLAALIRKRYVPGAVAAAGVGDLLGDGRHELVVAGVSGVFVLVLDGVGFGTPQWVPVAGKDFASYATVGVIQVGKRATIVESFADGRLVELTATGIGRRSQVALGGGPLGLTANDAYVNADPNATSQPNGAAYVALSCSRGSTPCAEQVTLTQGRRLLGGASADIRPGGFQRVRVPTHGARAGQPVEVSLADSAGTQRSERELKAANPVQARTSCEPAGAALAVADAAATGFVAPNTNTSAPVAIACNRHSGRWIELPVYGPYSEFHAYGSYVGVRSETCDDSEDNQTCSPDLVVVDTAHPGGEIEAFGFLPRLDLPFPTPCPLGADTCGPGIASYAIGSHGDVAVLLCPLSTTAAPGCSPAGDRELVSLDGTGMHTIAISPSISDASLRRAPDPTRFGWTDSTGAHTAPWHGAVTPASYDASFLLPYSPTFPPPR